MKSYNRQLGNVSGTVPKSNNFYFLESMVNLVDDAVLFDDDFADFGVVKFRNHPARSRVLRQHFSF